MVYEHGLFIFRRDLRTYDNLGFIEACKKCSQVSCCFIFTPEQVGAKNPYRSNNAIQFMIESLHSLSKQLDGKIVFFYGSNDNVLKTILQKSKIDAVFFNRDYSPYAVERDSAIDALCKRAEIPCIMTIDYYLYEPGTITTLSGGIYKKFTPFYENVLDIPIPKPISGTISKCSKLSGIDGTITLAEAWKKMVKTPNVSIMVHGGREHGLEMLKAGIKSQKAYSTTRDYLAQSTTGLSAHLKFGCISVREFYWSFKSYKELVRQLIWREYYAHVLYGFPEVLKGSYQPKYKQIYWRKSAADFEKWKTGTTGFPVVDAGMRQLNATGYMHNRCRIVTATFLIKVVLIEWRLGEQYFAQKLTDYDPASNNGNWQGISGTGTDMKPYYRTMSPWIQSYKFDRECEYIKKWVPELVDVPAKDIHNWFKMWNKYGSAHYPKPMVDFQEQTDLMLKMYQS